MACILLIIAPFYTNLTCKDAIEKYLQHLVGDPVTIKIESLILLRIGSFKQQPLTGIT
jgi:hypothetical protein